MDIVKVGDQEVIVMRGRYHLYEGYSSKDVVLPVDILKGLGVDILVITNASGG